jgi:hypothetical protein
MALAIGHPGFLYIRGYWKELEEMLVLALRAARAGRKNLESVKLLLHLGWLAYNRGDFKRTLLFTREARSAIVKIRNPRVRDEEMAKVLDYEGQVKGALGLYPEARTLLERSLAMAPSRDLLLIQAVTLHNLGTVADLEGKGEESHSLWTLYCRPNSAPDSGLAGASMAIGHRVLFHRGRHRSERLTYRCRFVFAATRYYTLELFSLHFQPPDRMLKVHDHAAISN